MRRITLSLLVVCLVAAGASSAMSQQRSATAQSPAPSGGAGSSAPTAPTEATGVRTPPGYVIGIQDAFDVVVYKEKEMSAENVVVRPDGKISLPLVNDIVAVGLTVEQLRLLITKEATKFVQEPTVSVVVKQINSRRVSISGQVGKPGQYMLLDRMTVVDLISVAGGAAEYAKTKEIRIARKVNGKTESMVFNYKEFQQGKPKALEQNIELQPGDIVTVP